MEEKRLQIPYPIIVEGKYDRLRLQCMVDAQILTTDGFGIFRNKEKAGLLRAMAKKTPLIVLTDSDGAGKVIRSHITSMIPKDRLIQLYVPRIAGKEARKQEPSAEGVLGVEGMEKDLLYRLLEPYADASAVECRMTENPLSKTDFYIDGLTGCEGSAERRDRLAKQLGLPCGMTPNALLSAIRILCTYAQYCDLVGRKETSGTTK